VATGVFWPKVSARPVAVTRAAVAAAGRQVTLLALFATLIISIDIPNKKKKIKTEIKSKA
jgi:hypothetical protein